MKPPKTSFIPEIPPNLKGPRDLKPFHSRNTAKKVYQTAKSEKFHPQNFWGLTCGFIALPPNIHFYSYINTEKIKVL